VVMAGPVAAEPSANWDCERPTAELSMVQIDRCKEQIEAVRRLVKHIYPEGERANSGVRVIRGSK
jgi:hypothetical protein